MPETRARRLHWLDLILPALLVALGLVSFDRAVRGRYDFHHFYLDARYVWQHGTLNPDLTPVEPDDPHADDRRQLPFYLPVVPLALAPLGGLGRVPASLVWAGAQVAALGVSLRILRRWATDGRPDTRHLLALGLALLAAIPAFYEAGKFNQLSYFVLVLVLGGGAALEDNRPRTAGVLLGLAAVLKLLPALFLPWLLLKRRWSAAAALVIAASLITVLPPLVAFGPQRALQYHQEWWSHNVRGDSVAGMLNADLPEHFIDRRNQSLVQVIARLAWTEHPYAAAWQPVQLPPRACAAMAYGVGGALLAGLLWATRRPWQALAPPRRRAELAVYAIGMLVFSPLLRTYYLVWAVPAVVLLARAAVGDQRRPRLCGALGFWIWVGGMVAWLSPAARVAGVHFLMLVLLGVLALAISAGDTRTGRDKSPTPL